MIDLAKELKKVIKESPDEVYYSREYLESVLYLIKQKEEYAIFDGYCHCLGPSAFCIQHHLEFVNILIRRAKKVGVDKVLQEVSNYLRSDKVHIELGLLLNKVFLEEEHEFANGVRLVKVENLKDSNLSKFICDSPISGGGFFTSFLTIDYISPKEYYSNTATGRKLNFEKIKTERGLFRVLKDTRLILSLSRSSDFGIPVVANFEIIPDSLSFLNNGISYGTYSEPQGARGPSLFHFNYRKADKFLEKFNALDKETKNNIRIAMERLNYSQIDKNWVNKCINLRICLENLFRIPNEYPIKNSIAERAPDYTSFSKTRVKNVYRYLSDAVHTGTPPEHPNITVEEITTELQKVIIEFIEKGGYPNWT